MWPVRWSPLPTTPSADSSFRPQHSSAPRAFLSVLRRLVVGRRRPKPGAEASVGLSAGHEHAPGIPTPSIPFTLREAERWNPNLKLFSYLIDKPPNFEVFAKINK
jgi:hypothetical protein